jgi:hypothetical protein
MKHLILLPLICIGFTALSQNFMKFSVKNTDISCPVVVNLKTLNYNTDSTQLALFEIIDGEEHPVASQIEPGHQAKLWFILTALKGEQPQQREFIIRKDSEVLVSSKVRLQKDNQDLKLQNKGKPILSYRHAVTLPPKEADPLYKRSAYVHPLVSPEGQVLTRIQPPDHYHHYGIWGPWTKTHINGREVDFWNLAKGQGTVKFAGFISEIEGDVYSGFKTLQQHIDFGAKGTDQVAINEVLDLRAWNIDNKAWLIDYTINLNCPLDSGIMLDAYRYGGGIGYRAVEEWTKDNCTVLTSEGKTRKDADGTNARWCIVEGESDAKSGRSGILFMSHQSNRMHPEPMRIWPLDANGGRGDMYFEFCPIRHNDWKIEKGKDYTLKYRLLVFDGEISTEKAEKYWKAFVFPLKITVEK